MKNFLTIRKKFYNFYLERMSEKVFEFFSIKEKAFKIINGRRLRDKEKDILYLPPTIGYTPNPSNCKLLEDLKKVLGLELKIIPDEIKKRFKENIEIQEKVLGMIKKRNEQFNYRCGLIRLTTGKGKSHVIIDIANYYQTNTLILVHNVKTLGELCQKFVEFTNVKPAQYGGGKKEIGKITIMTKKSFSLDFNKIQQNYFGLVLIDEAPIGFSKKLWDTLNIYFDGINGIALYGLSGTPEKNDLETEDLEKYFGKLIQLKNQKNNGYNILPKFKMYDYYYNGFYEYENTAEMRTAISENVERLKLQIEEAKKLFQSRKCLLIFSDRKLEVGNFYENRDFGFTFKMTGDTKIKDDEANIESAKKLVEAGKRVCIIGTIQKIGVGVDIPFIDTIFLASAIKFRATVIQAIGRGLRKHKNKDNVLVGVWNDLPILAKQKTEKLKTIEKEYLINKKNIEIISLGKEIKIKI